MKLAAVTSSIKGFHVYRRSSDIGENLKCVLEETNRHSNTAIKLVGGANETIGHIPYFFFFFFLSGFFFHEHSRITALQGKGEGISLTSHYHFYPLQRHLDISRAIIAESSSLHIASSWTRTEVIETWP